MEETRGSWAKELIVLLKFAGPISIAQLALIGMGMTDVIVAGNAGKIDLAAVMIGANVWEIIALFFMGVGLANAPLIGRHFGVQDWGAIREQLHQSAWLALACGILTVLLVYCAIRSFHLWDIDPEVRGIAVDYLLAVLPGAACLAVIPLFRASLESMNEIHFVMKVSVIAFVLNIFADYLFVFGGLGIPAMGGAGCGYATSIILTFELLAFAIYLFRSPRLSELKLLQSFSAPRWSMIGSTLLLGLPIGFSMLMEMGFFGGMGLRMADIGVIEAGAHAIAINIAAFVFMVFISVGYAVTVRVSQALGREHYAHARQIIILGLISVVVIALFSSTLTYLMRNNLPLLFNQDPGVVRLAASFLIFAALFQFFDGLQAMAMCSLRAYKDTAVPSGIQFVAFWVVGMPLGIFLPGMNYRGELIGSEGIWIAFCISLLVSSGILLWRLYWRVFRQRSSLLEAI